MCKFGIHNFNRIKNTDYFICNLCELMLLNPFSSPLNSKGGTGDEKAFRSSNKAFNTARDKN